MTLHEAAAHYVAHKQSMGMRFRTEASILKSYCQTIGDVGQADPEAVEAFLAGNGPVTRFWHRKYEALAGFYRFAVARQYLASSPLPKTVPKAARLFVPHIFSHEELKRLLAAADAFDRPRAKMDSHTCRALILLLYGAGLRIGEAISLTLADVCLSSSILTIRESKFYKTRLVPIGSDLATVMASYQARRLCGHPAKPDAPFFVCRTREPLTRSAAENTFSKLRLSAGVLRLDGARYQPRLHDLRHTAAVHRLVSWYRQGADVQRLLPQLSAYLGHASIAATQCYLTLTPELLREAGKRFERYALEEPHA
jgi:integrase/recombinase XerD